jgi:hypothetical protein
MKIKRKWKMTNKELKAEIKDLVAQIDEVIEALEALKKLNTEKNKTNKKG